MEVADSDPHSTALQQEGKLFDLPRELRDEIYRHAVKSTYNAVCDTRRRDSSDLKVRWRRAAHFPYTGHATTSYGILFVSKRIRDEVVEVLYSESTFRINLQSENEEVMWLSSRGVPQHMMNIELEVAPADNINTVRGPLDLSSYREIWNATLRCINYTNNVRKTLHIRCRPRPSDISNPVPEWMYLGLASMTRFRTVIVELPRDIYFRSGNYPRVKSEHIFEELEHRMEALGKYLRPTLGPAAVKPRYGCGYHRQTRTLTFHPQEHLSKNSRAEPNNQEQRWGD